MPTNSGSNTKKYKEMKKSIWTGSSAPQSFITKGKHRLKQHIDTVYLNNGDEFEVELFNPTPTKVLAKIEMNGNSIGAGIILRPGERVFLERYLDEAKKFLFETYEVEGDNKDVQKAIANNGDVVVRFYDEQKYPFNTVNYQPWVGTTLSNTLSGSSTGIATITTTGGNFNPTATTNTNINATYTSSNTAFFNSSVSNNTLGGSTTYTRTLNDAILSSVSTPSNKTETGRVEKGSNSDQSFVTDYTNFSSYPSSSNWWKILPNSQKLVTIEDLVTYCTECGSKRKKDTHKFCPSCGTKF